MKRLKRALLVFTLVAVVVVSITIVRLWGQFEGGTYKPMQQDFDRLRLSHLLVIAKLMDEYRAKTGHFPLDNQPDGKPVAVVIASDEQLANDKGRVRIVLDLASRAIDGHLPERPDRIERLTLHDLTKELEDVLGRSITLPHDPQRVPLNKPSVYVYTCYRDVFDVTAFLHNKFPFARKMSDFNHKVSVGSVSNTHSSIWTADELRQQPEFQKFVQLAR